MILDYLRLAVATGLVLLPGRLVARALGQRSMSATLAWTMLSVFLAWLAVFSVHADIWLAIGVMGAIALVALVAILVRRPRAMPRPPQEIYVLLAGLALGLALWSVAGAVTGDALFHLGRVQKLVELGDLHLETVDEFRDGGLHPGYAFPLWHGFLALVTQISGLDPEVVVNHEASVLAPLACTAAWEAGVAVFGSYAAGWTVLLAQVSLFSLAPAHGGAWATLELPGTISRQLFVPAAITLFFRYEERRWPPTAAALAVTFGTLSLVHPTYALFLLLPLAAYALVRLTHWRSSIVAIAAAVLPSVAVLVWLAPLVEKTVSHNPAETEKQRALRHYAEQLDIWSLDHYRLAPQAISRGGAVAVAALLLVPLAGFAIRRRWAAFVLGGSVAILALMLVPTLFTQFSDAVSLSQSRRAAGFLPLAFALAGGLALAMRSIVLLPAALVAGALLQRSWSGDFAYGLVEGGPGFATWVAFAGGAAALVMGLIIWPRPPREHHVLALAGTLLLVLPVAAHGALDWTPRVPDDVHALSPQVRRELKRVPPRSVIIAPLEESYRLVAAAPIYAVAVPPAHVADTTENRPYERRADVIEWLETGDPAIPRKYGATWGVIDDRLVRLDVG